MIDELGNHKASGGCGRTWVDHLDGLHHQCRAARGAEDCRCPCGAVYRPEPVQARPGPGRKPKVTDERMVERVRQLHGQIGYGRIAKTLQVSKHTVRQIVKRRGAYA